VRGYRDDETDAQEASGLLEPEDVLEDDGYGDVLDRGYSPRDSAVVGDDYAEGLDGRLARELPDGAADEETDGLGDVVGTDGELRDDEVGGARAGRLAADDDGYGDDEAQLWAGDEGIDGAAASAEEAAVHLVDDDRG
jgi:Family of unknown function (DUF5709)